MTSTDVGTPAQRISREDLMELLTAAVAGHPAARRFMREADEYASWQHRTTRSFNARDAVNIAKISVLRVIPSTCDRTPPVVGGKESATLALSRAHAGGCEDCADLKLQRQELHNRLLAAFTRFSRTGQTRPAGSDTGDQGMEMRCQICGSPFRAKHSNARTCSDAHRKALSRLHSKPGQIESM